MAITIPEQPKQPVQAAQATGPRFDEKLHKPGKFEITPDDEFTVEIPVRKQKGRWTVCKAGEAPEETHWVKFRMWDYAEELELRKVSTQYDPVKHWHFLDHDALNRMKIQRLMKSWSFEIDNVRLKLLHVNGVMVDESYNAVMKLHPNIIRHIVEQMNMVLEFGG